MGRFERISHSLKLLLNPGAGDDDANTLEFCREKEIFGVEHENYLDRRMKPLRKHTGSTRQNTATRMIGIGYAKTGSWTDISDTS